jgi:hypothetical protein
LFAHLDFGKHTDVIWFFYLKPDSSFDFKALTLMTPSLFPFSDIITIHLLKKSEYVAGDTCEAEERIVMESGVGFEAIFCIKTAVFLRVKSYRAEVVGSNPTRSISYYEGTTVLN